MRPEIDDTGREDHGRAATWALVCAPLAAHLGGDSGSPAVGAVLWLGVAFAVAQLLLARHPVPASPPDPPHPFRRAGDPV
jgi:hypothetical protein